MICAHCHSNLADDARFCGACGKVIVPTDAGAPPNDPFANDAYAAMIGREIAGRYRIIKKLGEGGMGAVFRAEQISLKRPCAVKLLRPGLTANAQALRRFNAEAEAVAKLSHPNTIDIYDFGQDTDGTLYIAMAFVDGKSLRDLLQQEAPLALDRTLVIAQQIAASLADAHANAIIHRDLKPDNVMLATRGKQRDVVFVLDFGIAKLRDDSRKSAAMTQAGDMLGTPQYMAPEQIRGEQIDGRADVYSLGCILYEMVTARMPFEATSVLAMLSKHLSEDVDPPSRRRPDLRIPPAIDQLILGALAKDAEQRPATMEQFGEQIAQVFQALTPDQRSMPVTTNSGVLPLSAVMGAVNPPVPTPMPFGVTAAAGPPPMMSGPAPTPMPMPTPTAAPPFAPPFVPASSMPALHVTPKAAKPDRQMLYMMLVVVAILASVGAYFALHKDDSLFGKFEPGFKHSIEPADESPEAKKTREEVNEAIKQEIEKAIRESSEAK